MVISGTVRVAFGPPPTLERLRRRGEPTLRPKEGDILRSSSQHGGITRPTHRDNRRLQCMPRVTKSRFRDVLGATPKPSTVWQRQFDGFNDTLRGLARREWDAVPEQDLWEYFHEPNLPPLDS
jgi:hypothetical protein